MYIVHTLTTAQYSVLLQWNKLTTNEASQKSLTRRGSAELTVLEL